ncbi:FlgD immunoglobulin-like domain containing protein [Streptomyces sp. RLB1-33]|uniref:FlgD immunoglobulin-like domain containing protein n=1 Tax=Streptomyces mirabilis TaxID=68239 RepID=UPI00143E6590|nr:MULTISPECIES: FlgD immunoglobulin-like domain containing protein [Streptomyces]QIY72388.1 hypothetical protein HEP84_27830 [Streptomyces sp. RLB1-33]QUW80663.1 hypothetical protein SMIR_17265 [Streptomyces mirabilis]
MGYLTLAGSDWEQAQLGDGFVATVEAGQLKVIDVRGGTAVSHTAGTFEGNAWDVDPYTGVIAQLRSDNSIRLTSSDVPVSALVQRDATVATSVDVKGGATQWSPKWWLNKPAASWKLVIANKATGAAVRTLSGGLARGVVTAAWNGKDGSSRLVPNGAYAIRQVSSPPRRQRRDRSSTCRARTRSVIPTVPPRAGRAGHLPRSRCSHRAVHPTALARPPPLPAEAAR